MKSTILLWGNLNKLKFSVRLYILNGNKLYIHSWILMQNNPTENLGGLIYASTASIISNFIIPASMISKCMVLVTITSNDSSSIIKAQLSQMIPACTVSPFPISVFIIPACVIPTFIYYDSGIALLRLGCNSKAPEIH